MTITDVAQGFCDAHHEDSLRSSRSFGRSKFRSIDLTVCKESFHRDVGSPDNLSPLCGVFGNKLAKLVRCHRLWNAPYVSELRLHPGIGQTRCDCAVQLIDDHCRSLLRSDYAVPHNGLIARHKLADGRDIRQCLGARIAGHCNGVQLSSPDLLDDCRYGA